MGQHRIASLETRDVRFPLMPGAGSDAVHSGAEYAFATTLLASDGSVFGTGIVLNVFPGVLPFIAMKDIGELGYSGPEGHNMVALENTPDVHNVVVCTLCSCYPWPTLGLPPKWYKAPAYRSRAVREPRTLRLLESACFAIEALLRDATESVAYCYDKCSNGGAPCPS